MPDARVSPRERLVLTAIIEIYIATGEPVASREVARFFANREGLSPATIRNVMATLGETGLLEQPHTSAGRVPTAAAFRYYVEQITQPDAQMGPMAAGASSLNAMPPGRSSLGSTRFDSRAFGASPLGPQLLSETRRGQIEGVTWEAIGFQVRQIVVDDVPYSWDEYLLFNPYYGFRYLSEYEGHWNYIRTLPLVPRNISGARPARRRSSSASSTLLACARPRHSASIAW